MNKYFLKPGTYAASTSLAKDTTPPGLNLENYIVRVINNPTCCPKVFGEKECDTVQATSYITPTTRVGRENVNLSLRPLGTGALIADCPDDLVTGGLSRGEYAVDLQMLRYDNYSVASGDYSVISGGEANAATANNSSVGGGYYNEARAYGATIAGGLFNLADGDESFVGGGNSNDAGGWLASIGGGWLNNASGNLTTIAGGQSNETSAAYSTVIGGLGNTSNGQYSISGGRQSTANGQNSIALGYQATASLTNSIALGYQVTSLYADGTTVKNFAIANYTNLNYASDALAAAGGVPLGGVYHDNGDLKIRIV